MRITRSEGSDSVAVLRLGGRLVAEGAAIPGRHRAGPIRRSVGKNLALAGMLVGAGMRGVLDAEPAAMRRPP